MKIFYVDRDPKIASKMHCDKHVCKMVIEYAQLMSTAHRVLDGTQYYGLTKNGRKIKRWKLEDKVMEDNLMKASHINHPSNLWVRESKTNYKWLYSLWINLLKEYTHRYGREHACEGYINFLKDLPTNIPHNEFSDPPQCMPDDCKTDDTVSAYQTYYIVKKSDFAKWKNRAIPKWFSDNHTSFSLT